LTEVLISVGKCGIKKKVEQRIGKILPSFKVVWDNKMTLLRSSLLGVIVGAAPAAGGTIASIMAYGLEKRLSKHPEKFGTGVPEGVMAPESANNASTGGAMIPLLTLGIPGDAVTAVLIGALMIHGLQPGPLLFANNPKFVSSIFILMALANIGFFFVASLGTKPISRILNISDALLYPIIGLLCIIGTYASRGLIFDVIVLIVFGILGFLMSKVGIPTAPLVLGLILGPIVEKNLTRIQIISNGSIASLFTRPISLVFMLLTIFVLFGPVIQKLVKKNK
jgi:putative tricarboxylic transport membrane protein